MIIASDLSPLIPLAILGKLDVLTQIFSEIYIPPAIYNEITAWSKPHSKSLKTFGKNRIKSIQNHLAVSILLSELDLGEAEAIILALENGISNILIDEHKGRKIARSKGLHPIGTIGSLIQAKKSGYIDTIRPQLDKLINNKIRISKRLYQSAIKIAGESL